MEMLKGLHAAEAGIIYLQDEKYEFRTKEGGKVWTVYGSPVCSMNDAELWNCSDSCTYLSH